MKKPIISLLTRWFVSSLGLWIATGFLNNSITYNNKYTDIIVAGFILAIINVVIKPVIVILSLPAILITLGLFMIIINGFMVFLVSLLYSPLHISNFWAAIFAGMVIGLVNYLVSTIIEERS